MTSVQHQAAAGQSRSYGKVVLRLGALMLAVMCLSFSCTPNTQSQVDEDKNPYLLAGRDWVAADNPQRARESFEQALEVNPRSALAHYELGLLSEHYDKDYVSAIYHYRQALRYRPDAYPADNAKVRIASCKLDLVRVENPTVLPQMMDEEVKRLRQENEQLREQLKALQAAMASQSATTSTHSARVTLPGRREEAGGARQSRVEESGGGRAAGREDGGGSRVHVIKAGETVYRVAKMYNVSEAALRRANPGLDPRHLAIGQRLNIPSR